MTISIVFLLLGLANGAVYASLALALVVTYRSSGVVNFATAAMALFTAYVYALLYLEPNVSRSMAHAADLLRTVGHHIFQDWHRD